MSRDATDDKRRTREDRATQPMDAGWLSFAITSSKGYSLTWEVNAAAPKPEAATKTPVT